MAETYADRRKILDEREFVNLVEIALLDLVHEKLSGTPDSQLRSLLNKMLADLDGNALTISRIMLGGDLVPLGVSGNKTVADFADDAELKAAVATAATLAVKLEV